MSDLYQQLATLSPEQRALFERRLQQRGISLSQPLVIPRRSPQGSVPLSFAQHRLWFIHQLDSSSTVYHVPFALRLRGNLLITALEQALNSVIQRHESLRTTFTMDDHQQPVQVVAAPSFQPLSIVDLPDLPTESGDRDVQIQTIIQALIDRPFDLRQPLLRSTLLRLDKTDHILVLTTHHIISDRWSVGVFLREMSLSYQAITQNQLVPLDELPIQYGDWAIWQRQQLQGASLLAQQTYWRQQLSGELPVLKLPSDRPRPAIPSYQGNHYPVALSPSLSTQLKHLAARSGATLFMLLLASFQTLLYRYTGQDDLIIGSDIANRDRRETEGLIGLLVNTLVLRTRLSGQDSFAILLERVQEVTLAAYAHQQLPFEQVVELVNPDRDLSQMSPLFQVKFDLQLAPVQPFTLAGLEIERLPVEELTVKYELRLNLHDTPDGICGQFEYSRDLFDERTIAQMATHWQTLLAAIVTNPQQPLCELPLLSQAEIQQLDQWNQTQHFYPTDRCIHQLIEAQVERTPTAIALVAGQEVFTYQDLNTQANQLAHYLQSLGVQPQTTIGVCLDRTPMIAIALLAILKVGAAYVPLDPTYPTTRLQWILADADVPIVLTQTESCKALTHSSVTLVTLDDPTLFAPFPTSNPTASVTPDSLAYLIYTSGSTGTPKGVMIRHGSTVSLLHWARDTFAADAIAGVLASTSICFDLSVFELFVPLSWGGKVILAENALALPNLPAADQVTLINTVPSAIAHLLHHKGIPASVNTINLAGEPLSDRLVRQLHQLRQRPQIFNLYGPSEATTYSTYAQLQPDDPHPPSIGRPIANTQVYVLDDHQQPVPIGVPGELYLGGAGLAQGYWHRPDLTVDRFISLPHPPLPTPHSPLYKTGDRVRWRKDGRLEFLGRSDHQIKLRGYRIELGEIESVLSQHPEIEQAIVLVHPINDQPQLIAYLTPSTVNLITMQQWLSDRLPAYMIPSQWMSLDVFPLTANGKIDRRALSALNHPIASTNQPLVPPQTETEKAIAHIWQQTLQSESLSIHHNFFELGGHSLLGMTIIAQISLHFDVEIPLRYLFQFPTIAQLGKEIDRLLQTTDPTVTIAPALPQIQPQPGDRHQPFPLTDIQQAYLLGRNAAFELGNVSTHGYREIETIGLTVAQMEQAFQRLIERHEMLRVIIQPDGQQQTLAQVAPYSMPILDLRGQSLQDVERQLADVRDRLSHQILPTDRYPLFDVRAVQLTDDRIRFCVSFDVLMGDAWSFQLLGQELALLLQSPQASLPPLTLTFRDYVLAEQSLRSSPLYERSRTYWQQRLDSLPPAPELPLTQFLSAMTTPRFTRRSYQLDAATWTTLKQRTTQVGITPSALILTAFATVLSRWSQCAHFTLNLTLFNRLPLHPEVDRLVGDFTASSLLEVDQRSVQSFTDHARQLQAQLWQDLDHRLVSGVEVLRQLARRQQRLTEAIMPVVFTSTLTQPSPAPVRDRPWYTEVVYSLSQTSQVYLDHQVSEVAGALLLNWDAIDDLFPAGMLDAMFASYCQLLEQLALDPGLWQMQQLPLLPADQVALLTRLNDTAHAWNLPEPADWLLHQPFFLQVQHQPTAIAIITPDRQFSYAQLGQQVSALAQQLGTLGVQPNQFVAIVMEKGWEQVVATLAILTAGAAYVPIAPDLPQERIDALLQSTTARIVLTQSWIHQRVALPPTAIAIDRMPEPGETALPPMPAPCQQPDDLAYVIYTSGSTGQPKGVMMTHRAVMNTILDINQRFEIRSRDRVLALSSLSFDLSVYDIFGVLASGGAIVIPDSSQILSSSHWLELIQQYQITLWNSVPALFQLLLDVVELSNHNSHHLDSLRIALLSGDWIPLTLPDRVRQHLSQVQLVSLGGATEAAIWSIAYPIASVDPTWNSIPYGRPLTNQQVYVLNEARQSCPVGVTGELYIGGMGVTPGYWNDPEKTVAALVPAADHAAQSEFLYRTGDLGRYGVDGTIEFLGRADFQVKLNGYRVELGEIEAALQQHPAIQQAVVSVNQDSNSAQLIAYVVPHADALMHQAGSTLNPLMQLELKQQHHNWRTPNPDQTRIPLPALPETQPHWQRQSYRQFLPDAIALETFSQWLGILGARTDAFPLPKYRYASAGSLYPVQTYLAIQPDRITGLDAGIYYYHPQQHELIQLSRASLDSTAFGVNQPLFEQAGFTVFLIGKLAAIAPIYGERSRDFCLLEAGYMSQLLMETAPQFELGLCPIGDLDFAAIAAAFDLEPDHLWLHGLVGGGIAPAWMQQRQPLLPQTHPSPQSLIRQKLQDFLAQKLPAYMIPQVYVPLDSIPLTSNGKVDRRALPLPTFQRPSTVPFVAPEGKMEQAIATIWQQSLQLEQVGIHDNFFDLGGNSLTALQVIGQLRQQMQIELSVQAFFAQPTIAEQVTWLESQTTLNSTPTDRIQPITRLLPERSQHLLDNLDQLSEAEVEALLATLEEV